MGGTLSVRIFAATAAVLVAVLAAVAWIGGTRIRAFHRAEVARRLDTAASLLAPRAADALAGREPASLANESVRALGSAAGLRLTIVADDGTVIGDSEAELPVANHGDRPEMVAARRDGRGSDERRSATTGTPTLYVAHRIDEAGRTLGFVRVAAPLDQIDAEMASLARRLLIGGVVAAGLGLAASWFVARRLAAPLAEMERSAAAFADGRLDGRVRVRGPREARALAESLNAMAGELRERIESARRARDRFEALLRGMAEGVVAVRADERVVLMNESAARLVGLPAPLEADASLWQAVRFPELERAIREVLATGTGWNGDAAAPRDRGRTLSLSVGPVRGGGGAVALMRDVTEVRRLEEMRRDLVANVSHELRTPLASIRGAIETIADPAEDEAARARFLALASRNVERLEAIVSDLLDLSGIEAEGGRIAVEPIPIDRPLRAAANALADAARRKEIRLEVEPSPPPAPVVAGNARRLEQAFSNLIDNALKYTPIGGRVAARVVDRGSDVVVEIEDTGIGIPADSIPRIFERFYRVDRARSREMGGTGLGLAIVKHIVLAHRGRVEVRSEEGRGSVFSVVLPRQEPA